jgi:hypothetical protein
MGFVVARLYLWRYSFFGKNCRPADFGIEGWNGAPIEISFAFLATSGANLGHERRWNSPSARVVRLVRSRGKLELHWNDLRTAFRYSHAFWGGVLNPIIVVDDPDRAAQPPLSVPPPLEPTHRATDIPPGHRRAQRRQILGRPSPPARDSGTTRARRCAPPQFLGGQTPCDRPGCRRSHRLGRVVRSKGAGINHSQLAERLQKPCRKTSLNARIKRLDCRRAAPVDGRKRNAPESW